MSQSQTIAPAIDTLEALQASTYKHQTVKGEIRNNLLQKISSKEQVFKGIFGYENSVIPELERALLSRHNILLLGLRGQAKTRIARDVVHLLDEWIPYVAGSEIFDSPFEPISNFAKNLLEEKAGQTPIAWLHRSERYSEKLATPDVSVADLIGDIDPIKAANLKLSFADEGAIHYGIIPRSNRGVFVINELPDLQARIQVALFNILQEGDIQIRGFKLRLPLDMLFVFTANPEDYTNRGSIVTPLKDRIESQIITHYPKSIDVSLAITASEARILPEQKERVHINDLSKQLIEQIAIEARKSEYVDQKSGVSARLSIAAYENLVSACELRMLRQGETEAYVRLTDFIGIIPAITGKIELVYEGEQEGALNVAYTLLEQAIRSTFIQYFPDPKSKRKGKDKKGNTPASNPYQAIIDWFGQGNALQLTQDESQENYEQQLYSVQGLSGMIQTLYPAVHRQEHLFLMEYLLHGLAAHSLISKSVLDQHSFSFGDILGGMLDMHFGNPTEEDDF